MLCIASFLVFGFLGIFLAEYRALAKEAFSCTVSRVKTGECDADFEDRLRATIIGRAMNYDKRLAKFLNHHLEKLAWLLLLLMLIAGFYAAEGLYNFVFYGDCNPATQGCGYQSLLDRARSILPYLEQNHNHVYNQTQ